MSRNKEEGREKGSAEVDGRKVNVFGMLDGGRSAVRLASSGNSHIK